MKIVKLHITRSLIENATRQDSHHCMIADAVKQQFPTAKWIQADLQSVRFSVGKDRFVYFTPPDAQKALIAFDQGKTIEPMELTLKDGVARKTGWKANHPKSSRRGKKYRKTRKTRVFPQREREFGLRQLK